MSALSDIVLYIIGTNFFLIEIVMKPIKEKKTPCAHEKYTFFIKMKRKT